MNPLPMKLSGVGRYLPERIVRNEEVEQLCGLSPGTVDRSSAGVKERRWVGQETASWMGAQAAREALSDAGLTLDAIDLIISASATPEQAVPDGAPLIQRHLGAADSGIPCFSVHATCLGFIVALDVAAHFLAHGRHKHILIVSSDVTSAIINRSQPESFMLFGDGAAAAVVSAAQPHEPSRMDAYVMRTFSSGCEFTQIRGLGTARHPNAGQTIPEDHLFTMDGFSLFMMLIQHGPEALELLRPGLSKGTEDIRVIVSHQPSMMFFKSLYRVGIPPEKVVITLDKIGNCGAASVPLTLYEAVKQNRIRRGEKMLLMGMGAGLSLAGAILTY